MFYATVLSRHGRPRIFTSSRLQGFLHQKMAPINATTTSPASTVTATNNGRATINLVYSRARSTLSKPFIHHNKIVSASSSTLLSSSSWSSSSNSVKDSIPSVGFRLMSTASIDDDGKGPKAKLIIKTQEEEAAAAALTKSTTKIEKVKKNTKPYILDFGIPSLIPEWKKMFKPDILLTDISAGLTVGCIAVPLSLAIAVASGVPAEVGLVTAAVSGVAGGLLGGTTLAVTGPAAAISLLIVGAVNEHGLEALPFITLACGGLQLASGVTRLGVVTKLVPVSVIAGFTTGVGTLILTGQLPKAFGMSAPTGMNPIELIGFIGENAATINPSAAALAVGTSAAMFALPKLHKKIPSALLAVGGATLATHAFGLDVALIGSIPSGLEAFQFGMPTMPSLGSLPSLSATVLLIYAMTSVESLLSCTALDKMKKTSYKHNPDQELVGQGLANMGSAMFMGMPVTSVIARSSLNVRLNATTRLPAIVQAGFVFSSVVFFSDSIAMIPMPALSGVLITTGMGMLTPAEFKHCYAVQKSDVVPFITTIGGMITLGLAEGIAVGCVTAVLLNASNKFMKTSKSTDSATSGLMKMQYVETNAVQIIDPATTDKAHDSITPMTMMELPATTATDADPTVITFHDDKGQELVWGSTSTTPSVYQINGPINFISMFEIDSMMQRIQEEQEEAIAATTVDSSSATPAAVEETVGVADSISNPIILDMHGVTSLEFTGMEELVNRLVETERHPIQMINCNEAVISALQECDPNQQITRFSTLQQKLAGTTTATTTQ